MITGILIVTIGEVLTSLKLQSQVQVHFARYGLNSWFAT